MQNAVRPAGVKPPDAPCAGAYATDSGSTVCTACPAGQVTGTLGAADSGACVAPPTVAPFDATLFNAAGSCAAALTLFNSVYNAALTTRQQVRVSHCWMILCGQGGRTAGARGRHAHRCCAWAGVLRVDCPVAMSSSLSARAVIGNMDTASPSSATA
jgi:hypothetical protein